MKESRMSGALSEVVSDKRGSRGQIWWLGLRRLRFWFIIFFALLEVDAQVSSAFYLLIAYRLRTWWGFFHPPQLTVTSLLLLASDVSFVFQTKPG